MTTGVDLKKKSYEIRKDIVALVHHAGAGHIGGDLSVTDILVALYYKHMNIDPHNTEDKERESFVLSKGHFVEAFV